MSSSLCAALHGLPVGVASVGHALFNDSRFHPKWRAIVAVVTVVAALLLLYQHRPAGLRGRSQWVQDDLGDANGQSSAAAAHHNNKPPYNNTYPLSPPQSTAAGLRYRVGAVADLGGASRGPKKQTWISYMKTGYLTVGGGGASLQLDWDQDTVTLEGHLAERGRGMELSDLVVFNGNLYSVDDRTGVIYRLHGNQAVPWVILPDGDGSVSKGFKGEWLAVKDQQLVVGGLGAEPTGAEGAEPNSHAQWVKVVGVHGDVQHEDWTQRYSALRRVAGVTAPDSLLHESAVFSEHLQRWFFLPRRVGHLGSEDSSLLLSCSADFSSVSSVSAGWAGPTQPGRRFSSLRFVPGTGDQVLVALRSEEEAGGVATYIVGFTLDGRVLMPETKMADAKYEGLEFI